MITTSEALWAGLPVLFSFPELRVLADVPQDPERHPEGCVMIHLRHCMIAWHDTLTGNDHEDLVVGLATALHDLGKSSTTELREGRWTSYGHEEAGEAPARAVLARITDDAQLTEDVIALVVNHMVPTHLYKETVRRGNPASMDRAVRRLGRKVSLERLARLVLIDKSGRPPKPKVSPEADWLRERAAVLGAAPVTNEVEPILKGRHLIELGMTPGLSFKAILQGAMERQLDGDISTLDDAIKYAKLHIT